VLSICSQNVASCQAREECNKVARGQLSGCLHLRRTHEGP
jgi:hypothetical protein